MGQINLSLTPGEVLAVTSLMMKKTSENEGLSNFRPSVTANELLFKQIYATVSDPKAPELNAVLGLYARSISNIIGIPSIMYRNQFNERPDEGNLATSVKETLGLWIKDFPYLVIADYLETQPHEFGQAVRARVKETKQVVTTLILAAVRNNLDTLARQFIRSSSKRYSEDAIPSVNAMREEKLKAANTTVFTQEMVRSVLAERARLKRDFQERRERAPPIASGFAKAGTQNDAEVADGEVMKMVKVELAKAIDLFSTILDKSTARPRVPERDDAETFETGQGVRKETFARVSPGHRKLRVLEIRSSERRT